MVTGETLINRDVITVVVTDQYKQPLNLLDIVEDVVQNVPEGTAPNAFAGIENKGKILELKDHVLPTRILFSTIRANKNNPTFEDGLVKGWLQKFNRNIEKVGIVGTEHVATTTDITKINLGWIKQAKDSASTHKVNKADYTDGNGVIDWKSYLSAIITAQPDAYKGQNTTLLMNVADCEDYAKQLGAINGGLSIMLSGKIPGMLGYNLRPTNSMTRGEVLFTPLRNLVFGIFGSIERYREAKASLRCVDWTFTIATDYKLAIDDAVTIGR